MGSVLLTVGIFTVIAAVIAAIIIRKRKGDCAGCPHCDDCKEK